MRHSVGSVRVAILAGAALPFAVQTAIAQSATPPKTPGLEEIVVTATRRAQDISKVPVSMTAFTKTKLDLDNVRMVDDIMRMTPGVQFTRSNSVGAIASISIRGVSSNAGSGTTGIYINDTPIQSRSDLGGLGSAAWPQVFDLKRVEVLRGPQGTLFGSGSEGGTVRFITPSPNSDRYEVYLRSDIAMTAGGGPTAGFGGAVNLPLVEDKLGLRVSTSIRHEGGYVDRIARHTNAVLKEDSNSINTKTFRIALAYSPTSRLTITPSYYYQQQAFNDASSFQVNLSDPDDHEFVRSGLIPETADDGFKLSALEVQWKGPAFTLISNTSYFDRHQLGIFDLIRFEGFIWANQNNPPSGMYAPSKNTTDQKIFTQEVRIQSNDPDANLTWTAGVFYQRNEQHVVQLVQDTYLPTLWVLGGNKGTFKQAFGMGLQDGLYTLTVWPWDTVDEQLAAFGQVNYHFTDKLTGTLGVRATKADVSSDITYGGPINGGTFRETASGSNTPITPKFGLQYQVNAGTMVYANIAKGYRIGGGNNPVSVNCGETTGSTPVPGTDLGNLGLTHRPPTYDDDSLWSYEVGSKTRSANGKLAVDASVYYIKWEDIQFQANLPLCGFSFTTNAGSATSKGFEVSVQAKPVDALSLGVAVGHVNATYDRTVYLGGHQLPGAKAITGEGDRILAHPWTLSFNGQLSFQVLKHDAYFRVNYTWQAKLDEDLPSQDPRTGNYDPSFPGLPEIQTLRLKLGALVHGANVALYVNNALDEQPFIGWGHLPGSSTLASTGILRPRTIGLTVSYRY